MIVSKLSAAEQAIAMLALNDRLDTLARYVKQCEALPLDEQKARTDRPERWLEELVKVEALVEKLRSSSLGVYEQAPGSGT